MELPGDDSAIRNALTRPINGEGETEPNGKTKGTIEVLSNGPEEFKTPYQRYLEAKELLEKEIRTFLNIEDSLIGLIKRNGTVYNGIWTWNRFPLTFIEAASY